MIDFSNYNGILIDFMINTQFNEKNHQTDEDHEWEDWQESCKVVDWEGFNAYWSHIWSC